MQRKKNMNVNHSLHHHNPTLYPTTAISPTLVALVAQPVPVAPPGRGFLLQALLLCGAQLQLGHRCLGLLAVLLPGLGLTAGGSEWLVGDDTQS